VQINGITNDSVVLIIFAIFPFVFVHLIFAVMEKNKVENHQPIDNSATSTSEEERSLKTAFHNNVISAEEYEQKLKEIKEKKNSKK
jgi:uncharacterized membrane protein